jgi:acyl-CoA synthetase (AMP-forming)/AMP-acid ligase II
VETPLAFVVLDEQREVGEDEVVMHCRAQLAGYKKPSGFVFVDALPRNAAARC